MNYVSSPVGVMGPKFGERSKRDLELIQEFGCKGRENYVDPRSVKDQMLQKEFGGCNRGSSEGYTYNRNQSYEGKLTL
jgi:hypothetical protein